MRQPVSCLTQSRFYSPAFNAAIFDGPIRIYFAQAQESAALEVYFKLQKQLSDIYEKAKENFKKSGKNVFIMLYPSDETFSNSFVDYKGTDAVVLEQLGEDIVLGVRGPVGDLEFSSIQEGIFKILNSWLIPEPSLSPTL